MLKDKVTIKVQAGNGGDGLLWFDNNKKPRGGDGGCGGDIVLMGDENVYDFGYIKEEKKFAAQNGDKGGQNKRDGKNGQNCVIKVPLITQVYKKDEHVGTIQRHGETLAVAQGGFGGKGNFYFRTESFTGRDKTTDGTEGEVATLNLQLELKSDVIFIGLPNAGKSSILNELTNAQSKVAPYPFTTLDPHLGYCEGLILMDLPGLIEGVSEGKGLGTAFLPHTKNTKLVAHFISLEEEDIEKNYVSIRSELKKMSKELYELREIIVLTKYDCVDKQVIEKAKKILSKHNSVIATTSVYDYDSLCDFKNTLKQLVRSN